MVGEEASASSLSSSGGSQATHDWTKGGNSICTALERECERERQRGGEAERQRGREAERREQSLPQCCFAPAKAGQRGVEGDLFGYQVLPSPSQNATHMHLHGLKGMTGNIL